MNELGIPALIAFVLNLILSFIAFLLRRQEKTNIAFSIFTFFLALDALLNFIILQPYAQKNIDVLAMVLVFISFISVLAALNFILELSGFKKHLHTKIFGIRVKYFIVYFVTYYSILILLANTTDLVYVFEGMTESGANITFGPLAIYFNIGTVFNLIYLFSIPIVAYRRASNVPRKNFIKITTIGLVCYYSSAPILEIFLADMELNLQYATFIAGIIASTLFYFSLVRFQFDKYQEVNLGLEMKVDQRTRHLHEAQANLIQSGKMAALGRLVAGIAHELNNPMGAIQSSNNTLKHGIDKLDSLVQDKKSHDYLRVRNALESNINNIKVGSDRVIQTVKKLKKFSRLDEAEFQMVDMNDCLDDTLFLLKGEINENIEIKTELNNISKIPGYPADVNQALHNVLMNAIEAVKNNGRISIKTNENENYVEVKIQDNGIGIPNENREKIFDPGFTTKGSGVGTGLGLSIVFQVMEQHQGEIEVDSILEKGANVSLRFPKVLNSSIEAGRKNG